MPHLLEVGLREPVGDAVAKQQFPFSLGSIAQLPTLDLDVPITIFVGENGSGKSTLLEAIAAAAELPALGVSEVAVDDTLVHQRRLASALRLAWRPRRRRGFLLRAEDFFGHLRMQARTDARIAREKLEMRAGIETPELDGPGGRHVDEQYADRYIAAHDSRSHGESFPDVFSRRLHPRGLYLLDEPEAPLSPMKQLVLIRRIVEAAENDAQFIIATHSPILLGSGSWRAGCNARFGTRIVREGEAFPRRGREALMFPARLRLVLASLCPEAHVPDPRPVWLAWRVLEAVARRGEVELGRPRAELLGCEAGSRSSSRGRDGSSVMRADRTTSSASSKATPSS